ncbi:MAG: NAD-dependent epimerase/dehydratase family protein, partial [Dolichospermum sp.]
GQIGARTFSLFLMQIMSRTSTRYVGRVLCKDNFVAQALRGIPLTVYGEGQQTRSFCYVSDLVNGLMRLMNGEHTGPINLGNPDEYTILELAQAVQNLIKVGCN